MPIENSLEGGVNATLDALARDAPDVAIVGEPVLADPQLPDRARAARARRRSRPSSRTRRRSRSARASCATELPGADGARRQPRPPRRCATVAEARRAVGRARPARAPPSSTAARPARGRRRRPRQRDALRLARRAPGSRAARPTAPAPGRRSVVFAGAGDAQPGWLVRCLSEFAFRGVNLTQDRVAPARGRLGHYLFLVDLEGRADEPAVGRRDRGAARALRGRARAGLLSARA